MGEPKVVDQNATQGVSSNVTPDAAGDEGQRGYEEPRVRSFMKAMSWRITAFTVTVIVFLIWTGNWEFAGLFALVDSLIKIVLYYMHERAWNRSRLGRRDS